MPCNSCRHEMYWILISFLTAKQMKPKSNFYVFYAVVIVMFSTGYQEVHSVYSDKVRMYEEMMTNTDNLESSLLTSNLLKICCIVQVLFCYKWTCRAVEVEFCPLWSVLYKSWVCCGHMSLYSTTVYYCLHRSTMGCSLRVTRAGVAGWECECQLTHY